jgi:hypothetical protein
MMLMMQSSFIANMGCYTSDQQWSGAACKDERGGDQARAQGRQGRGRHARLSIARVLVSLLVTIEDGLIDDFSFSTCVSTFFQE